MQPRVTSLAITGAALLPLLGFLACGDASHGPVPDAPAAGASGSGSTSAGAAGSRSTPSCDRALPPMASDGLGPTCRVDEECPGDTALCDTGRRAFGLLCGIDAECTRSGFFACERGGLCASQCKSDAACPAFERCLEGRCRSRPCEDGVCPAGASCGPTFTCEPVPCEGGNGACGEQELCVQGDEHFACVSRPCSEDATCAPSGLCIGGGCRAKICGCDDDCGPTTFCIGGRCAKQPGVCVLADASR